MYVSQMQYAIAAKRQFKDEIPADWVEKVRSCEGLRISGDPQFGRLIVEATTEGIETAKQMLGDAFHIEPLTFYRPSDGSGKTGQRNEVGAMPSGERGFPGRDSKKRSLRDIGKSKKPGPQ